MRKAVVLHIGVRHSVVETSTKLRVVRMRFWYDYWRRAESARRPLIIMHRFPRTALF